MIRPLGSLLPRIRGASSGGRALGPSGERLAARFLRRSGYKLLARNQRTGVGEADLVCLGPDRRTLVIVEVKTRLAGADGRAARPEDAITAHKRRKLVQVAMSIARARGWRDKPLAIDVVAIDWRESGDHAVRHYPRAVTLDR